MTLAPTPCPSVFVSTVATGSEQACFCSSSFYDDALELLTGVTPEAKELRA
jgi:hypothetical protein